MPDEWIDYEHDLQLKILERMRDYGMTPVLSMFTGFVPSTFTKHFPNANVTETSDWAGFPKDCRTYMLEVTDPQFNQIAKRFIEIQTETYGTSHIYNGRWEDAPVAFSDGPSSAEAPGRGAVPSRTIAFRRLAFWSRQAEILVKTPDSSRKTAPYAILLGNAACKTVPLAAGPHQ